jgi:serine/threonine-protein kinase
MARQAVLTAMQLDDQLADAHAWLGVILCEYDWEWEKAEEQFRRAIELNPNLAYAHKLYAEFLSYIGRFDESIAEARLARQLDPISVVNNSLVGLVLYRARRYDEALVELSHAIELDARHPTPYLPQGLAYSMKQMHSEAVAALERARALSPKSAEMVAQLGHAHARAGRPELARAALAELRERLQREHVSPFFFALLHIGLGEPDTALDWLERGYHEKDWYLCVLKTEPPFDPLRGNARFQDLVRRIGFP